MNLLNRDIRFGSVYNNLNAKEGYSQGEQIVKIDRESRQRLYELELDAFLATIAGTQQPDRPVSHELLVQETLLRVTGVIKQ